jgi:hypothetical protein
MIRCHIYVSYDGAMTKPRHSEIRRRERWKVAEARRKRDKSPSRQIPKPPRAYHLVVTHKRDTPEPEQSPTGDQMRVAKWFGCGVKNKEDQGWSRSKIATEAGLSRKDFYRFLDPAQAPKSPRSATIRRICSGLQIDYAEAAQKLGWGKDLLISDAPSTEELGERIRRTRELADHPKTSERRRRELMERVEAAEQALRTAATNRMTAAQIERTAAELLRPVFEENEDVPGQ